MKIPLISLLREFRWHLIAILILLTVRAQIPAEEVAAIHIPTAVYALIDQADADVAKVHAALAVKLSKEQAIATKKGDLELAMWLKAKVESLQPKQAQEAGEHSSRDVILYPEPNYKGQGVTVRTFNSVIDAYTVSFPNDGLRSIKVPEGYTVTVYEGNLGAGQAQDLTHDIPELSGVAALGMTSFKIVKRTEASR